MTEHVLSQNRRLPDLSLKRLMADDPILATAGLLFLALILPLGAAAGLDARILDGEGIWTKPLKFAVSIAVFLLTLAAFARHLPKGLTDNPWVRGYRVIVALSAVSEMLWIAGAASLGVQSHYNESTPFLRQLYGFMGVVAVTLTSASLVYGVTILRNRVTSLQPALRWAIGLGLILTFVLTVPTASTLAALTPLVGTPQSGATIPILGWSREVGDLRVAHFFATHALQIVPFLVWIFAWRRIGAAIATAGLFAAFTIAAYFQALAGLPILPAF